MLAPLMKTTVAPFVKKAIHLAVHEFEPIAQALMRTLNKFETILNKPKVKAAYEEMYATFTDPLVTEPEKAKASKKFRKALAKASSSFRHAYGMPAGIVAKSITANLMAELNAQEELLGPSIARALLPENNKAFMKEYLQIALKYYIVQLIKHYTLSSRASLRSEEEYDFVRNALKFAAHTHALPPSVVEKGTHLLEKGIEVVKPFREQALPEEMVTTASKTNLLSHIIYSAYKLVGAMIRQFASYVTLLFKF
jgi:hypothetical protein